MRIKSETAELPIQSNPSISSPHRIGNATENKNMISTCADENYFSKGDSFAGNNFTHTSKTEKEIMSHEIIKQILNRSQLKTVNHCVNKIPLSTKLYAVPLDTPAQEFVFDTIPPHNSNYISTSSQKVYEINKRLSDHRKLSERVFEVSKKNIFGESIRSLKKKRPASADENTNKRVSVSGLVSYNFSSVNARRSMGLIPEIPEQIKIVQNVERMKKINSCSVDRQKRMALKRPNQASIYENSLKEASVCDFHVPTEKFLKVLQLEGDKDKRIFGERMQKLRCIKQYMENEKVDYEQAEFIISEILASQPKRKKAVASKPRHVIDDEKELKLRKKILTNKKVMLRHLYFTDL